MKISEIFYSIQGEGIQMGLPTVFVRLFSCDLRCSWCDTMYAVEGRDLKDMSVTEVENDISLYACKRVCLTGGEPLIQKDELVLLAQNLLDKDYSLVLETSGHKTPPSVFWTERCLISMDCKCPSSNMQDKMDFELFLKLRPTDQLKFVIKDQADYEYARGVLERHAIKTNIVFQTVDSQNPGWLADNIIQDGLQGVRLLPQFHKIMWGAVRGV